MKQITVTEEKKKRINGKCSYFCFVAGYGGKRHYCEDKSTVIRNGKRYCALHDPEHPERIRARNESIWERLRLKWINDGRIYETDNSN